MRSGARCTPHGGGGSQATAAASGQPPHPRRGASLLWDRNVGDDSAPGAQGRRPGLEAPSTEAKAQAEGAALRACRTQSAVAVGSVHVPAAAARAGVRGGVFGRSLAVRREPGDGASPAQLSGVRGSGAGDCRLQCAARDPDRSGAAVHGVARTDQLRGGVAPARHPPHQEPPAPPADVRQDRAVLEDDVGRVSVAHCVCRLRRLPEASGAVRAALQLPAPAPGPGGSDAGGPLLPSRATGASRDRGHRTGQRATAGPGAAAAAALLLGGTAGRPGPCDQRQRLGAEGAGGGRRDHDSPCEGERR